MRDTIELLAALDSANVRAFLHMIRVGEGTADPDGYRRHFGGKLFDSYADHPRVKITAGLGKAAHIDADGNFVAGKKQYTSSAAGAYQFLAGTWDGLVKRYGFDDFEPATQDCAAVALIDGRKALDDVLAGRFEAAVRKCAREWASLPESPYGQPTKTMAQASLSYHMAGGRLWPDPISLAEAAPTAAQEPAAITAETGNATAQTARLITPETVHKEATMPTIREVIDNPLTKFALAAINPLLRAVPELAKLFMDKDGTTVPERNVAAAVKIVTMAQDAMKSAGIEAPNAQAVAEAVTNDPAAREVVREVLMANYFDLTEGGGGGLDGARKADATAVASGEPVWKSPSFVMGCLLLPLVYLIVGNVTGLYGVEWAPEARAGIAGSLAGGIVMGLIGYYFGQTTSRNRTPAP